MTLAEGWRPALRLTPRRHSRPFSRAVGAGRDRAWPADGVFSGRWLPASPVTGALDAFQWKVPLETSQASDAAITLRKIEELVVLGNRAEPEPTISAGRRAKGGGGGPAGGDDPPVSSAAPRAGGLRVRTPEAGRPITVEVEPVGPDRAPRDEAAPKPAIAAEPAGSGGATKA